MVGAGAMAFPTRGCGVGAPESAAATLGLLPLAAVTCRAETEQGRQRCRLKAPTQMRSVRSCSLLARRGLGRRKSPSAAAAVTAQQRRLWLTATS